MTRRATTAALACAALALGSAAALGTSSCSQTPVTVPVRTFERAQTMDVVCMQVRDELNVNTLIVPAKPVVQSKCAPVAADTDGSVLPYHLFALVTQTTRGEIAVVDLTSGVVVDVDSSTPGINFLPVGQLPTDVAVTPDGVLSFVGSADVSKPAIYALDNQYILGDQWGVGNPGAGARIPNLTSWSACALPQAPGPIAVVPIFAQTPGGPAGDAGSDAAPDAGVDAGADAGLDAGLDAGADAAVDEAGADADVDAALDAGVDGSVDSGADAGEDAAIDAGVDAADAGVADTGTGTGAGSPDAGPTGPTPIGYVLAVVLPGIPGDSSHVAQVITLDPADFKRGAGLDAGADPGAAGDAGYPPGELPPCKPIGVRQITSNPTFTVAPAGPAWDDGIDYDAGFPVDAATPPGLTCGSNVSDGGTGLADGGTGGPSSDAGGPLATTLPEPHATSAALDVSASRLTLYVADDAQPYIHVIDVTDPIAPKELAPLRATSVGDPSRVVSVGALTVSPSTHDFHRFLYALDKKDGSIIVYDVTDPLTSPKVPLVRPHPELNPFQPADRIIFNVPIAALAFVHHDFVLQKTSIASSAESGLVCNPNPNANFTSLFNGEQGPFKDDGAFYRYDVALTQQPYMGPSRLRGIFALVTLANGSIVTIDLDDWDGPCRRPDPMSDFGEPVEKFLPKLQADGGAFDLDEVAGQTWGWTSSYAPPQPAPSSADDTDPFHAPFAANRNYSTSPVTDEAFFPVSAPHRPRSFYLLRNDSASGLHVPSLNAVPQLINKGAPAPNDATAGLAFPLLLPTFTALADPAYTANPTAPDPYSRTINVDSVRNRPIVARDPILSLPAYPSYGDRATYLGGAPNVRFAYEDPQVQVDQDWQVTYEGVLPGFNVGIAAAVQTEGNGFVDYQALVLQQPDAFFCRKGVEDADIGALRAEAVASAMTASGLTPSPRADHRTTDYVQLIDDILASDDPYWTEGNSCWASTPITTSGQNTTQDGIARQAACVATFGATLDPANPAPARDFPILEAYDDHLLIGRYGTSALDSREIVPRHPTNVQTMAMMQCCFHNQVHFNVRTGSEWVAIGASSGYLHHVEAQGGRCVESCDPRLALMNGRALGIPRTATPENVKPIYRDSPIAFRNPMFAGIVWNGVDPATRADKAPDRDMVWKFTTRGQFVPQVISIASTTTSVSPQSMRFIDSLGQVAVVDGASQGLVLIDLNIVGLAHTPYF